jgi:hypothetical protein
MVCYKEHPGLGDFITNWDTGEKYPVGSKNIPTPPWCPLNKIKGEE